MMKRLSVCLTLAIAMLLAAAPCARADHYFFAFLTGDQENPPTGSTAFGIMIAVLSDDLTELNWGVYYAGLQGGNVTGRHFHGPAPVGMNAPIIRGYDTVPFPSPEGLITGVWAADDPQPLTATRIEQLASGLIYWNIHTQTWPGGEIRGQVWYLFSTE
jgi:CHRD domain